MAPAAEASSSSAADGSYVDISTSPFLSGSLGEVSLRPIQLSSGRAQVRVPVPVAPYEAWIVAVTLRDEFHRSQAAKAADSNNGGAASSNDESNDGDDEDSAQSSAAKSAAQAQAQLEARVVLTADFLGFLAAKLAHKQSILASPSTATGTETPTQAETSLTYETNVLQCTWAFFNHHFVGESTDVHKLVAELDSEVRVSVLRSYYEALVLLEKAARKGGARATASPALPTPKLLAQAASGEAELFALFGGQGTNEVYFDELQALFDTYRPLVGPMLLAATQVLEAHVEHATQQGFADFYTHGLDVFGWLSGAVPRPPVEYLASIPLSLPLIGLTQLTQYLVSCRVAGLTPGEFRDRVKGATGHSQGVISALTLAASDSYDSFIDNVRKSLSLLFHIGKRGQEAFPERALEPALIKDAVEGGEGEPTPMLSVTGLTQPVLEKAIAAANAHLDDGHKVELSLFNGRQNFIVTGPPRSLFGLASSLRSRRAEPGADQTRVPFSKRKPVFNVRFLPVGVPYHSSYLEGATDKVLSQDLPGEELWKSSDLKVAVRNTFDGSDLASYDSSVSLVKSVCDQIFTQHIHWSKATDVASSVTHCIDFGTGGMSGIGGLTARGLEGRGVRVVVASGVHRLSPELYDVVSTRRETRWTDSHMPKLARTPAGKLLLDTPYSRLIGRPPLLVPGMTPTTVSSRFVAATTNAGYPVELAGGGIHSASALRSKIAEIQGMIEPGAPISLNALYINPRSFNDQFPEYVKLAQSGANLQGFTVAAGIPSVERAKEIVEGLQSAGITYVCFKPGGKDAILQVCNIAAANPDMGIVIQWSGGRAGGHHSSADMDADILSTYGTIRKHRNLVLLAGSGLGGWQDTLPYMTGDWSLKYGAQPMPYDGAFYGSRTMVALEAETADACKQLIVDAPGVEDHEWEGTYERATGGIITVVSELGEPIHKVATRGTLLWAELDKKCFGLPKEKRLAWLAENRDYVIKRLNADWQKPWFPAHLDGTPARDLAELTYEEITRRLVRLVYVAHKQRWVHISHRTLVGDWLRRVEERFAAINTAASHPGGKAPRKTSMLQSYESLDAAADGPSAFLDSFFDEHPDATRIWISSEDISFFLNICSRRGQKPVPFIPVMDENFSTYFKKDSLFYSEDLDAVFDQDAGRTCILQGPVAARFSTKVNEPIAELMGNIEKGLIDAILERFYQGDVSRVPVVEYLGPSAPTVDAKTLLAAHKVETSRETVAGGATETTYKLPAAPAPSSAAANGAKAAVTLPGDAEWLELLAGPQPSWLRALLRSVKAVQGKFAAANPSIRVCQPRHGQRAVVTHDAQGRPVSLALYGAARSFGTHQPNFKAFEARLRSDKPGHIDVTLFEERLGESIPLALEFVYRPDQPWAPLHEVMEGRNDRIKRFYWQLWFHEAELPADLSQRTVHQSKPEALDAEAIRRFCQVVGNRNEVFLQPGSQQAPMDFAIVAGWQAIMQALMASTDADLLSLVHLDNSFRMAPDAAPLRAGDVCQASASVRSVRISDTGKTVSVGGSVLRRDSSGSFVPVIDVVSSFFFRGRFSDFSSCFETSEDAFSIKVASKADVAVLMAKEWFDWTSPSALQVGTELHFRTKSHMRYRDTAAFSSVTCEGQAYVRDVQGELAPVADISYEADGVSYGNPVIEYVKRQGGATAGDAVPLENGYTLAPASASNFAAPATNEPYSRTSGDFNPIHVNPYFSSFASLPGTITHGLFSSAATRRFVETIAADGRPERVAAFKASFLGMVLPGDQLTVKLRHTAMRNGLKVVAVETFNQNGDKVLEGQAEIAQPPSVIVFTGQGSQEKGMGMDLYESSPVARALWDEADEHLKETLGFSIIEIVRENPTSKTVHFGGVRGLAIRDRYMNMTYMVDGKNVPLFDISNETQSYTFFHPEGLLNATNFTQPALVLMELAAHRDMQSKGLLDPQAAIAGHSLGEYASLASLNVLDVRSLVDVVFVRGITMQRAVKRDAKGQSDYGMAACSPARVGLTDAAFLEVVSEINSAEDCFLEAINFNVSSLQLVVAGNLLALHTLTLTLDKIGAMLAQMAN